MRILTNGQYKVVDDMPPYYLQYLGFLVTPTTRLSCERVAGYGMPCAADNSAFKDFSRKLYLQMLDRFDRHNFAVSWITVPDVVGDSRSTSWLFNEWYPELEGYPLAFVAQDGMEFRELPWSQFVCLFIGGTTEWKLSDGAAELVWTAKQRGKLVHMGRVNSDVRMRYAFDLGCDSIDGMSYARFGRKYLKDALEYLDGLHRQQTLFQQGENHVRDAF